MTHEPNGSPGAPRPADRPTPVRVPEGTALHRLLRIAAARAAGVLRRGGNAEIPRRWRPTAVHGDDRPVRDK